MLITITLVAFLVLVLVSLAAFTRVETQVAANSRELEQARQNALMALNIAVGELQKYTGPDQRTTARADINVAWADTTSANGRWLGAYGNGAAVDTAYTLKPSQIPATLTGSNADAKGSQARLLNWLVSGNEGVAFDPATAVGADGRVNTPPSDFAYAPDSSVDLETASAQPSPSATQTLLVGESSVSAPSDYVAAPLVPITVSADILPGFAANDGTPITVGRYAWWVGDEGAKARVNLPMATDAQAPHAFVSARRAAIEWVDKVNPVGSIEPFASDQLIGAAYDPAHADLPKIISTKQLTMLAPASAPVLATAGRLRFHDLGSHAVSVLADNYAGGLKKDLSALLAVGAAVPADTDFLFTPDNDTTRDSFGVPTWGALRSFARTTTPVTATGDVEPLEPRLSTPTSAGIAPVMTYMALGFQYAAPEGVADGNPIRLAVFPLVVLWNPYTAPLKAHRYEVGMMRRYFAGYQLQVEASPGVWEVKESIDFSKGGTRWGTGTAGTYMRFVVDAPDIPPGASLIFTLQNSESGRDYDASLNDEPKNIMTNGLNPGGHVLLNFGAVGAVFEPGESVKNFRVSGAYMLPPITQAFGMSGGEVCAYLGDVASVGTSGVRSHLRDDGSDNHQWHQYLGRVLPARDGASNNHSSRNALLQGVAPLTVVTTPTSNTSIKKIFGDHYASPDFPDVRWIAQSNPRAGIISTTPTIGLASLNQFGFGGMHTDWQNFVAVPPGLRASSGLSLDSPVAVDTTLFEFRPSTQPLLSLGQLQHANLSLHTDYPAYAIGNSLADFHFVGTRDQVRKAYVVSPAPVGVAEPSTQMSSYYDLSWLLNRALWDRYFVSTVPHDGTTAVTAPIPPPTFPLPNPRHVQIGTPSTTDLLNADASAAHLLLAGGFNINSTSEQAWRAVLGGINQLGYDPFDAAAPAAPLGAALPRFSRPTRPADSASAAWQGYRELTDAQIAELAKNIVAEIRNRGPFVSLADFVNRRLVDNPDTATDERIKGVIQAALDASAPGPAPANPAVAPFDDTPAYTPNPATTTGIYDTELMRGGGTESLHPYSSVSAFAPQFLTQADVLSALGAGLSARSDTFTIRTYGETVNPATQDILGRAWCEAVVQRLPAYVDSSANAAEDAPAALNATNKNFGRHFKIISFRWLTQDDI